MSTGTTPASTAGEELGRFSGTLIGPEDLDLFPEALEPIMSLAQAREDFQRRYILEVLERNNGNRTKTARDLGVDPRTIFRYLEREPDAPEPGGID